MANIKPPQITINPNGVIYVSAKVREDLGQHFHWHYDGKGLLTLGQGKGAMFYEGSGTCCDVRLVAHLGITKQIVAPLIKVRGKWEGSIK